MNKSNRTPLTPEENLRSGDEGDRSSVQTEQNLQIALRQSRSTPTLAAKGTCHWCDEPVAEGLRFCLPVPGEPIEWSCIRAFEGREKARPRLITVAGPDEPDAEDPDAENPEDPDAENPELDFLF